MRTSNSVTVELTSHEIVGMLSGYYGVLPEDAPRDESAIKVYIQEYLGPDDKSGIHRFTLEWSE